MLRISKLTDYGTLVMAFLADNPLIMHTAKDISFHIHLALPTVSKLLKLLAKGSLLQAHRGAKGGYSLARPALKISLAQIISAIEGDIGLTECSHHTNNCSVQTHCAMGNNWRTISDVLRDALQGISLADMTKPLVDNQLRAELKNKVTATVLISSIKTAS